MDVISGPPSSRYMDVISCPLSGLSGPVFRSSGGPVFRSTVDLFSGPGFYFLAGVMKRPEQQLQKIVCEHLSLRALPSVFWFHVGNGGWRSPIEAKVFKSLGVRPGVPDLIMIHDGRTYGLELKANGGRPTDVQRTAHVLMRQAGAIVDTAVGIDAAIRQLEQWGLLRGQTQ